jgi:hypothetical protein
VRLVFGVDLVPEGDFRLVEHDGQMGRPVVLRHVAEQLPQHVAEAEHGIDLQPVGLAVERRQRVVGAEDVGGTVDQKDMVALAERFGGNGSGGGLGGGFGHGRNLRIFAANDSLSATMSRDFCTAKCVGLACVGPPFHGPLDTDGRGRSEEREGQRK